LGVKKIKEWNVAFILDVFGFVYEGRISMVARVTVNRLKGRSFWGLKITGDSTWYWKGLLKFRKFVWDQSHYIVGDGKTTQLWWHPDGVLVKSYG